MDSEDGTHADGSNYLRRALHAGSWYEDEREELDAKLAKYLKDAQQELTSNGSATTTSPTPGIPRAIVAPHAGYEYSGETAGYAYAALAEAAPTVRHILVLHPSHHVRLSGCAVSGASTLATPLGNLTVDDGLRRELLGTGKFDILNRRDDENEHSGELQYPFLYKALSKHVANVTVLPIMVGNLYTSQQELYGKILAPIVARDDVFVIVSSDFCHWGDRFHYSPYEKNSNASQQQTKTTQSQPFEHIYQYIDYLDHEGMDHISMQDPGAFVQYLKRTKNTICGRYPIEVWLNAVKTNRENQTQALDVQFVRYAQSSHVKHSYESSVSYASGVARLANN